MTKAPTTMTIREGQKEEKKQHGSTPSILRRRPPRDIDHSNRCRQSSGGGKHARRRGRHPRRMVTRRLNILAPLYLDYTRMNPTDVMPRSVRFEYFDPVVVVSTAIFGWVRAVGTKVSTAAAADDQVQQEEHGGGNIIEEDTCCEDDVTVATGAGAGRCCGDDESEEKTDEIIVTGCCFFDDEEKHHRLLVG
jgi:hypothetical protein